ncbi:MAG: PAS domain S-box protein, partial [Fidelibacterota bacterium]
KMSVELNVTPVEYKEKPAVLGIMRDISERVKVERELKQRFKELEIFVKATEDREMKMVELKKEVNSLLKELGREAKY